MGFEHRYVEQLALDRPAHLDQLRESGIDVAVPRIRARLDAGLTFDGNTNSVIGSVSTTYPTQGVAIMGSNSYILESGLVDVVDIESNAIVDSVPVYPYVQHIAATPHYVFVGTSAASAPGAYVLDPTTNLVVAYIADSDLGQLVSDPQSDTVYVLGQFTNAIRVLQFREPNFSVSCAGGSASSAPGTTAPVGCTLSGSAGYTGSVGLSCTGLPAGASCGFTPSAVNLGTVSSIVVAGTIAVPSSIVPGVYPFDVQAADGLLVRSTSFSLVVPTCSFVLTPQSTSFGASGGSSSAGVAATTGCAWTGQSTAAWLKITSGSPGNGNGSAGFSADPNASGPRTATVTIGDQNFIVTEAGSQTITFAGLANQPFGAAAFTVSATASSGLAVSFASTTPLVCTVSNNTTVTLVAGGKCTIEATQAGNTNYPPAAAVDQSFQVNQASQTISFGSLSNLPFGGAAFGITATASSGLAVSFASTTPLVCTVSNNTTVTLVAGGKCTIEATQAGNTNYPPAAAVDQSFQVNQASQTISFGTLSNLPFSSAAFGVTATASSGLAVSFITTTSGVCIVSGNLVTIKAYGKCTIEATQTGNSNYLAATPVDESLQVIDACDINQYGSTTIADVQGMINEALGSAAGRNDLNGDAIINVADVQIAMNDAVGLGCAFKPSTTTLLNRARSSH